MAGNFSSESKVYVDMPVSALVESAIIRQEGILTSDQALRVTTGKRTGRSPKDRYIVSHTAIDAHIDWGTVNQPFPEDKFNLLWDTAFNYLHSNEHFLAHLWVGADERYSVPVNVMTEMAWHNLFAKQLFIERPEAVRDEAKAWTILSVPSLEANPSIHGTNSEGAVIINFIQRRILIVGILYAGEIKKAMFSVFNYLMPEKGVFPMHGAANMGASGDVALFFGLSGTGKTTLSADPERYLIGDDEHGWSQEGVFNFEGGCYAKCINLSKEHEPLIWNAIRYGTILENVVVDEKTLEPRYADVSITENTRAAYPLEYIPNQVNANLGGHPKVAIFLSCDLYGVLPPVSCLTKEQAAYYFLSGYTALVGSTEVGQAKGIKETFSTCFGAPFFPRPPQVYAQLLVQRLAETGCQVYLVNTGWTGGPYGIGKRFAIPTTRAIVHAITNGYLKDAPLEQLPGFHLWIPKALPGVETDLLNPMNTWENKQEYEKIAKELISKFQANFKRFQVSPDILAAGPDGTGFSS